MVKNKRGGNGHGGEINTKERGALRWLAALTVAIGLTLGFNAAALAAITLYAPSVLTPGQAWELRAARINVESWTVRFNYITYMVAGPKLTLPLIMPAIAAEERGEKGESGEGGGTIEGADNDAVKVAAKNADGISTRRIPLEVEATLKSGKTDTAVREIGYGTAREALIAEWIAAIQMDDGTQRKSNSLTAPGQCKKYLANMFAVVSAKYELTEAPGITLYMPERPNDEKSGRVQGSAWVLPLLGTGNPFVEAAAYDFSESRTARENKQAARALLEGLQPGDVLQLMAIYNNGARGTHTLMITAPYDPMKDMLYWCDSNLKNKVIDGVRYGTVMAYQSRTVEEVIGWLSNPACAATAYRLVEGISLRAGEQ